jgi:hypothetical protein
MLTIDMTDNTFRWNGEFVGYFMPPQHLDKTVRNAVYDAITLWHDFETGFHRPIAELEEENQELSDENENLRGEVTRLEEELTAADK